MRDLTVPFPSSGAGSGCCRMTLQWRRKGVTGWLQLKHADDERSRMMRSL